MATCPECKAPDAYVGLGTVECAAPSCRNYTLRRAAEVAVGPERLAQMPGLTAEQIYALDQSYKDVEDDDIVEPQTPYYMWVTHHHDFGD